MSICRARDENLENQKELEKYLFSNNYSPNNITVSEMGKKIDIKNEGWFSSGVKFNLVRNEKAIGKGAYGAIYKYTDSEKKVSVALKFTDKNDEEEISEKLRDSGCDILRVKYINKEVPYETAKFSYFMELADGDLVSWMETMLKKYPNGIPKESVLNVSSKIWKQLDCLYKNGIMYADMKFENILFKCDDPSNLEESGVRFMLGDLGGAVPDSQGDYASSYPPIEYKNTGGFIKNTNMKESLCWEFGILVLMLLRGMKGMPSEVISTIFDTIDQLYYSNIYNINVNEFKKNLVLINRYSVINLLSLMCPDLKLRKWEKPVEKQSEIKQVVPKQVVPKQVVPKQVVPKQVVPKLGKEKLVNISRGDLRLQAKLLGLPRYSKMNKSELLQAIAKQKGKSSKHSTSTSLSRDQLRERAKNLGYKGYSKMTKDSLLKILKS
jgi:serine/threonine protein kinase